MKNGKRMVPLQPMLDHLADAEKYMDRYISTAGSNATKNWYVLEKLRRIDESIRSEWGKKFRANKALTLGEIVVESYGMAKQMWETAPVFPNTGVTEMKEENIPAVMAPKVPWVPPQMPWAQQLQQRLQEHNKTKRKGLKGDGKVRKGKDHNGKAGGGGKGAQGNGRQVLTGNTLKNGRQVCKPYNDPRGCKRKDCTMAHACDALKPNGEVCGGIGHTRLQHK